MADSIRVEHASTPARIPAALDSALLEAAGRLAAAKATEAAEPAKAIDDALEALHDAIAGIFASAFVLEHEHLWLVAQRG
ncbi:MAG: hypothetical protein H0U08_05015, partial [Actinobacteria bacterium]|nr:hypothetical protein [Actinomycetota bacterium]